MIVTNCTLVSLNISGWEANRQDRRVSAEVADANQVKDRRLCRLRKSLLPKTKELDKLNAVVRKARTFHYQNTHDWMHQGPRILPTANAKAYLDMMRKLKREHEKAVLEFLDSYDAIREEARNVLGSLYNSADYPSVETLRQKYNFEYVIQPMPASSTLLDLGLEPEAAQELKRKLEDDMAQTFQQANRRMWDDLYGRLEKLYTRLSDDKAQVQGKTLEAVRSLAELLPRMNITNDERLSAMATRLSESLAGLSEKSVNHNPSTRERVMADTQTVFNVMQAYMHPRRAPAAESQELLRAA